MAGYTTLDELRQQLGLTRPEMLAVLGEFPRRVGVLRTALTALPPLYRERAEEVQQAYRTWALRLQGSFAGGRSCSTREFAQVLDLSPAATVALCRRWGVRSRSRSASRQLSTGGHERYQIDLGEVKHLLSQQAAAVRWQHRFRGPLAASFLRYYRGYHQQRVA